MRSSDSTVTARELHVLEVVWLSDGADLSNATRPEYGQIESRIERRLAKAGLLTIDAGACARLTDDGQKYVRTG